MSRSRTPRRAVALLVCIFVMAMVTAIVVLILETQTTEMSALRHTIDYERAVYLAAAGASHALAELETDPTWRTGISSTEFPGGSGRTYSVTVVDSGEDVIVTATGTAGGVTRKLQLTVDPGD